VFRAVVEIDPVFNPSAPVVDRIQVLLNLSANRLSEESFQLSVHPGFIRVLGLGS
jgi:hypothetical protein